MPPKLYTGSRIICWINKLYQQIRLVKLYYELLRVVRETVKYQERLVGNLYFRPPKIAASARLLILGLKSSIKANTKMHRNTYLLYSRKIFDVICLVQTDTVYLQL